MSWLYDTLVLVGVALEAALAWRLLRRGMWRSYSFFSLFILWVVVHTAGLYAIRRFAPGWYTSLFWPAETADVVLRFLVVWEVFRHTFPNGSVLRRNLSKGFGAFGTGLVILAVGMFWSFETYSKVHSVYPALERSFGFAQAVLILGVLLTARYYGVPLGRNMRGIAVAFGAWVSLSTANNAVIDLTHTFLPYWRVLWPLSFIGMFGMWVWAMWEYAPNPPLTVGEQAPQEPEIAWWQENWNRTISATRKVIHS